MQFYLAPLEGVTGYIVRNAFAHHFPYIDKYFTPFFPAAKRMNKKNNPGSYSGKQSGNQACATVDGK